MTEKGDNKTPEFEPPQACVQRVIKSVLPDNVQIGKDAKAAFSRSAGIFIMYLTACANDFCRESKRQTISAADVMQAIRELEFTELEEPLKDYLEHFRKEATLKKKAAKSTPSKKEKSDKDGEGDEEDEEAGAAEAVAAHLSGEVDAMDEGVDEGKGAVVQEDREMTDAAATES